MCVLKADKSNASEISVKKFDGMYMFSFESKLQGFYRSPTGILFSK